MMDKSIMQPRKGDCRDLYSYQSEDIITSGFDCLSEPVFIKDEDSKYVYANKAFLDYSKLKEEELIGKSPNDIFPPDEAAKCIERDKSVLDKGIESVFEEKFTDSLGTVTTANVRKNRFTCKDGKKYIIGIIQDISSRKRAQDQLAESERRYKLLVENQKEMVVEVDTEGRFIYINPVYCKTFGKKDTELIGKKFMPLVHPDDREKTAEAMKAL
jgi:PAS domain S-box-containing protein